MTTSIPLVMDADGPIATSPTNLRTTLINNVAAEQPDYTANLPGSLIEDISSTDVGALALIDQARVDTVNDVTPYGANAYILAQLGTQFGIPQGSQNNASVYVTFSGVAGQAGYVFPPGFIVSDGTHQYTLQDGGVVQSSGSTNQLYAVATQYGTWSIPAGTVTTIVSSIASGYTFTVTNAQAGTIATSAESVQDYRARVLQAGQANAQGVPAFIKTQLQAIAGVTPRLVSIIRVSGGWEVICGGGDAYSVAYAIYKGTLDLSTIKGSSTTARNVNVTITDYPDTYDVTFINPPEQTVTVAATWNTNLTNFTGSAQVNQLAATAIQNYINGIVVGQPINLLEMTNVFQSAITSVLDANYLSTLSFAVTINDSTATPVAGTSIILSDSESYFYASDSSITVTQG